MSVSRVQNLCRIVLGLVIFAQSDCFAQNQPPQQGPAPAVKQPEMAAEPRSRFDWDFRVISVATRKIEVELRNSLEINFVDTPLSESLKYLANVYGLRIEIDHKALAEKGISEESPVTLESSDLSLKNTLQLLLGPLALDYVVKCDVVLVTTCDVAADVLECRVYNTNRIPTLGLTELKEIITKVVDPGGWNADNSANMPPMVGYPYPVPDRVPGNRDSGNGDMGRLAHSLGSISVVGNILVIRQTYRVHEEIIDLLEQLEKQQLVAPKLNPNVGRALDKLPSF